jgi:hypothetical protein
MLLVKGVPSAVSLFLGTTAQLSHSGGPGCLTAIGDARTAHGRHTQRRI